MSLVKQTSDKAGVFSSSSAAKGGAASRPSLPLNRKIGESPTPATPSAQTTPLLATKKASAAPLGNGYSNSKQANGFFVHKTIHDLAINMEIDTEGPETV